MKLVRRYEWGARAPRRVTRRHMNKPSTGHWNGPKVPRVDHSKCASLVRGIQNFHMDGRGWNDIAYNFVICQHGYVFEGRGINVTNGANGTNEGNFSSHAIMWLDGEGNDFTEEEKLAFKQCVAYVGRNAPAPPTQAIGHRDHKSTECPGDARYKWIRSGMPVSSGGLQAPVGRPVLRLGSRGDAVKVLQTILNKKAGGGLPVDGYFGPTTERKVKLLQKFFGLTQDGVVGAKTWDVLNFINAR